MRDEAGLKATIIVKAHHLLIAVTADAVGPMGELREQLAHFKAIAQVGDARVAEGGHGGGKADFVAVAARPTGIPGLHLGDFGAGEDGCALEARIVEVNAIMGRHLPTDAPAVLFQAAVAVGVALLWGAIVAAFGPGAGVKGAGHFVLGHVNKDVEDAACACGVVEGQIHAPILTAVVVQQPAGHGDHGWVACADVAQNGLHLGVGGGDGHGLGQDVGAAARAGLGIEPLPHDLSPIQVDHSLHRAAVAVVDQRHLQAVVLAAASFLPGAGLAGAEGQGVEEANLFARQQLGHTAISQNQIMQLAAVEGGAGQGVGHGVELAAFGQGDLQAVLRLLPIGDEAEAEEGQVEEDQFEEKALSSVDIRHRRGLYDFVGKGGSLFRVCLGEPTKRRLRRKGTRKSWLMVFTSLAAIIPEKGSGSSFTRARWRGEKVLGSRCRRAAPSRPYVGVGGEMSDDEEGIGYGVVGADVLLVQVVYPAVQGQLLVGHSLAQVGITLQVAQLQDDVALDDGLVASGRGEIVHPGIHFVLGGLSERQPAGEGGLLAGVRLFIQAEDAAAVGVAADDDVGYFEGLDGIFEDGGCAAFALVIWGDDVGDVAQHEEVARFGP